MEISATNVEQSDSRRHENARSRINKAIGGLDGLMSRRRRRPTDPPRGKDSFPSHPSASTTILYCVRNAAIASESARLLDEVMTLFPCKSSRSHSLVPREPSADDCVEARFITIIAENCAERKGEIRDYLFNELSEYSRICRSESADVLGHILSQRRSAMR